MLRAIWLRIKSFFFDPAGVRRLEVAEGDFLPKKMPRRDLVLVKEGRENWSIGMICPCGCGRTIELLLIPDAKPHWTLTVDNGRRPTLEPSVWLKDGCRSHFWVQEGKIVWCD
jgi:hypothetical protein